MRGDVILGNNKISWKSPGITGSVYSKQSSTTTNTGFTGRTKVMGEPELILHDTNNSIDSKFSF